MGCNAWLGLLVALGTARGMVQGDSETVLGTLGMATTLRIPPRLRELTVKFGEAFWKRGGPQKKQVLVKYSGSSNSTNYFQGQMDFQKSDFSLEILNTSRQDGQLYEYTVSKGPEEEVHQIHLKVYEPVSVPSIQILRKDLANGSCALTLACRAERGDDVSYSWDHQDSGAWGLCQGNSSFLNLSYPPWNSSISCVCTAANPVSRRAVAFNPSECSHQPGGSVGWRTELLALLVVPVVVVVVVSLVLIRVFRTPRPAVPLADQEPSTLARGSAEHTIYSQVQRVEKPKGPLPSIDPPSCTTIYAAATGPAATPSRAPQAPPEPPTLPGHPPLSQSPRGTEPTTVYASVMMPRA